MSELRVCVLGGSNSLMTHGYVPPMIQGLEKSTGKTVLLHNFAIGGTYSHFGLWQLLDNLEYRSADIIIVEYALNDAELFNWRLSQNWALAYEGLLRKLRSEAPQAQIICPLLYSRSSTLRDKLNASAAQVLYLNHHYNVAHIDINARLCEEASEVSAEAQRSWFKDGSHYKKEIQDLISKFVVEKILAGSGKSSRNVLAQPISSKNYCAARSAKQEGLLEKLFSENTERRSFSNSVANNESHILEQGSNFSFALKGQLVAFITASTRDDGVVRYRFGDDDVLVSLRRTALDRNKKFSFLMNNFVPDQYFRRPVSSSEVFTPISIDVLTRNEISEANPGSVVFRPNSRMPLADQKSLNISIVDIVFTGDIRPK